MARLFILSLLFSQMATAQKALPRYENDTLYTASGFKIYPGQSLKFGKGSGDKKEFRYLNVRSGPSAYILSETSFILKELIHFGISQLNNSYIEMTGSVNYKDGSKGWIHLNIAFDNAIRSSELIVPADTYSVDATISPGQKNLPRFEKDTLYTVSGYKLTSGQVLKFGTGSGKKGSFAYFSVLYGDKNALVPNTEFVIRDLSHFGVDDNMEAAIELVAGITFKDGSKGRISFRVVFEKAMAAGELIIPEQYRTKTD